MNDVRNMGELGLLYEEESQEQRKVNLLWNSNTAVPPCERLEDDAKGEGNRPHLLPCIEVGILGAVGSEVVIDVEKDAEGEYLV